MTVKGNPDCKSCGLCQTTSRVCVMGVGQAPCDVMVIGESAPYGNSPFEGASGQLLRELMEEVGFNVEEVYFTHAVHCRPPEGRTPKKTEINKCRDWLDYEREMVDPKYVLLLGSTALQATLGKTGIKSLRGQPIKDGPVTYLPALSPSYVLRDPRVRSLLRSDLSKFKAMVDGGGTAKVRGLNYRIVATPEDVEDMMRHLSSLEGFVYDLETTGLYPWRSEIVSINIGNHRKQWCIPVYAEKWPDELPWTAEEVGGIVKRIDALKAKKCNHNGKFDALFMAVHFGVDWRVDFDTMLAHYILDENARHGLDIVANERYGIIDWDIPLKWKQGVEGTLEDHARYACLDVLTTSMLWVDLEEDIAKQPGIALVFNHLLMPAARLFVDVELHGITVNRDKFDEVEKYLRSTVDECDVELDKLFPGVNWGSTQQVAKILFHDLGLEPLDLTKKGSPSTSESVLKRLAHEHPVVKLLLSRRAAQQQLSFFIDGWKPYLVRSAGRWTLHPSFKLHGTVTGRLSCENPNLQQVPRDPKIRQLITAKPGWTLIEVDLSQIELRILAELSGDPEMLRCFQTGIDIHWLTAMREIFRSGAYHDEVIQTAVSITRRNQVEYAEAYDILLKAGPDECVAKGPAPVNDWPGWKEVRKRAKAINFGYAYGMWWRKFIIYARDNYGVDVTELQAQESRKSYFELYARLPKWHSKQRAFAHTHGYVRSLAGRRRRLPLAMSSEDTPERREAERQSINSPVQSFASDLNLMIALELTDNHPKTYAQLVGTVHDAVLVEVRNDKLQLVVEDTLQIARGPKLLEAFNVLLRVPIEAEAKIGPWGLGKSPEKVFGP